MRSSDRDMRSRKCICLHLTVVIKTCQLDEWAVASPQISLVDEPAGIYLVFSYLVCL